MNNFITTYLDYTSLQESPDNFHVWSAMSTVAACLRRLVWVDMGYFKVYPNLFIVLVSPPGKCRKSVSITMATDLAKDLPDVVISADAITREALILELDKSSRMADIGGEPYIHSSLTIISKELSVFLGTGNTDLLSLLTDLYDSPIKWEYKTKNKGVNTINGVWLNMLGASTPAWLVGSIPINAIGGGFTSRVIFVVEDDVRRKNALPFLTDRERQLRDELTLGLERISMIKGEFQLSSKAKSFFINWYERENIKIDDQRFAGYSERKHIHAVKIATVLAVCEGSEGLIEDTHLKKAIHLLTSIEGRMIKAFGAVGRSPIAADIDEICSRVMDAGHITREQLMRDTRMNIHPEVFDTIITTLKSTEDLKEVLREGKIIYFFNKPGIDA